MAWVEGSIVGVRDDHQGPTALFINTAANYGAEPNVWHDLDVCALGVPADVKAVFLQGMLIITHGTTGETANLTIAFRSPTSTMDAGNYIGQVIEPWIGGGQRSPFAAFVPVIGGKVQYQWRRGTQGSYPANSAYGLNFTCQAYVRGSAPSDDPS
jgi:hypothetical protein